MTEHVTQEWQPSGPADGVSWPRISGFSFAIAIHVALVLVLLTPMSPPA